MPTITTITPYWGRPEAFRYFEHSLDGCLRTVETNRFAHHLVLLAGESKWKYLDPMRPPRHSRLELVECCAPEGMSIGHYHNIGAEMAKTEWIMKLDVDCLIHPNFFVSLHRLLGTAKPRQWFNIGMLHMPSDVTDEARKHLWDVCYFDSLVQSRSKWAQGSYKNPVGSNFVCRREDYLLNAKCHLDFAGYGWEDYYQMYHLEKNYLGKRPIDGATFGNVTQKCRGILSRQKALQSFQFDPALCLFHQWHPIIGGTYRQTAQMLRNKMLLYKAVISK